MSIAGYQVGHDRRVNHARIQGSARLLRSHQELISESADAFVQHQAVEPGRRRKDGWQERCQWIHRRRLCGHTLPSSLGADIALLGYSFPILIEFFAGIELTKEVSEIVDWTVTLA
jgi:hypothetical protein